MVHSLLSRFILNFDGLSNCFLLTGTYCGHANDLLICCPSLPYTGTIRSWGTSGSPRNMWLYSITIDAKIVKAVFYVGFSFGGGGFGNGKFSHTPDSCGDEINCQNFLERYLASYEDNGFLCKRLLRSLLAVKLKNTNECMKSHIFELQRKI